MAHILRKIAFATALAATGLAAPAAADGIMDEPLPRFEDRLCPGIIGLDREYAGLMVSRLRENADALGLRLAGGDACEANVVIAFVEDSRAYLAEMMDERGYLFNDMTPMQRRQLLESTGASGVWHQVAARTRDGIRVGRRENLAQVPTAGMWQAHSRIYRPVRHDITYALVLLDRDEARGLTLRQLADYATLRALATEFPAGAGEGEASMLTLFEDADKPMELTAFDRAWLERLYAGLPNIPASTRLQGVEVAESE
ncbi:hypothetical protein [Aurantiacibacter odishensis]|uniref:hypothetical protein n=1 Tax=Aurantiacibacter odishensis TaxID=1155476 RepID=UPI000E7421B3|nr:hypothetical protein [Aurantiacibacter odishensis]